MNQHSLDKTASIKLLYGRKSIRPGPSAIVPCTPPMPSSPPILHHLFLPPCNLSIHPLSLDLYPSLVPPSDFLFDHYLTQLSSLISHFLASCSSSVSFYTPPPLFFLFPSPFVPPFFILPSVPFLSLPPFCN